MRRFSEAGDVERARRMVDESQGTSQCYFLATQHCNEAVKHLKLGGSGGSNGGGGVSGGAFGDVFGGSGVNGAVNGSVNSGGSSGGGGFEASAARNSLIRITKNIVSRTK